MIKVLNGKTLYRIGTGWVYDVSTGIGYVVVRSDSGNGKNTRGKVEGFIEAFTITDGKDGLEIATVDKSKVPLGVMRKAVSIYEKLKSGELKPRNVSYS